MKYSLDSSPQIPTNGWHICAKCKKPRRRQEGEFDRGVFTCKGEVSCAHRNAFIAKRSSRTKRG
jgi:hypothetical protein